MFYWMYLGKIVNYMYIKKYFISMLYRIDKKMKNKNDLIKKI